MENNQNLTEYWNNRYLQGGNSGAGSYGQEALMKASLINHWIKENNIRTINEIGCGDGNNLLLYNIPISYTGFDISEKAIEICREKTRKIPNSLKYYFTNKPEDLDFDADLCLCLDVWFHQTSDEEFSFLCYQLFELGKWKYIIIYSSDTDSQFTNDGKPLAAHMHPREVLSKVAEYYNWKVKYWCSGYKDTNDITALFPAEKKFFLLERV
jgi:SAM-dependent methyltransferase